MPFWSVIVEALLPNGERYLRAIGRIDAIYPARLLAATLDAALRMATAKTFDRLVTAGCQSVTGSVLLLARGASPVAPTVDELAEVLGPGGVARLGPTGADADASVVAGRGRRGG